MYVKEGQGAVLLCVPPKAWPGKHRPSCLHWKSCIYDENNIVHVHPVFPFTEEVTYRWIYNEFPVFLPTDRRRFVSQKTGNLYISKVEAQDAGNYSCFVSSPIIGKSVFSKFIPLIPLPPDDGLYGVAVLQLKKSLLLETNTEKKHQVTSILHSGERKYPADIKVKFPDTTAMLASNITLECFALGK